MAKKQQEEETALVPVGEQALATVPAIPDEDNDGMENVGNTERLPQLKVCQSQSPEREEDSKWFVPGLKEGDLFLTRLRLIVKPPINFVVAFMDKYAAIPEIGADGKETGKVLERVAFEDPRGRFGRDGSKPAINRTFDFYVILPSIGMAAVIRMNKTKVPVAEEMELQFKLHKGLSKPLFQLDVFKTANNLNQKFFNFRVVNAGSAPAELYWQAKKLYAQVAAGLTVVEADGAEVVEDDDIPF